MGSKKQQVIDRNTRYLPSKVWHNQVCSNCSRTLCIGPIMLSPEGAPVCGRCTKVKRFKKVNLVRSLYNVVACAFRFQCPNCFEGCNKYLSIFEMPNHESQCRFKSTTEKSCRFCDYKACLSDLVSHSKKLHRDQLSFDGMKILFPMRDGLNIRKMLFFGSSIFVLHIEFKELGILFGIETVTPTKARLFTIKIHTYIDPSVYIILQTNHGLDLENVIVQMEKSYEELEDVFDAGTPLLCEVLVETLELNGKELNFQKRFVRLMDREATFEAHNLRIHNRRKKIDSIYERHRIANIILKCMGPAIFKCTRCQSVIPALKVFLCTEGHACCSECLVSTCNVCSEPIQFNALENVQNFPVKCDWPSCMVVSELHYAMAHKTSCCSRPYMCPLKDCFRIVPSLHELKKHWHYFGPNLHITDGVIAFHRDVHHELFWVYRHDLYRVSVKIDTHIQLLVEEIDVISNNNIFHCFGVVGMKREKIPVSFFCTNFQVFVDNRRPDDQEQCIYPTVLIQMEKKGL